MIPIPLLAFHPVQALGTAKGFIILITKLNNGVFFNFTKLLRSSELGYGCFKLVHFSKNLVVRSSAGPKILAFGSHCSANFQPILDCFIPDFKLKHEDSDNMKADRASTVVFNLHQIKRRAFFWDTRYMCMF